jgi:hypothetical protein
MKLTAKLLQADIEAAIRATYNGRIAGQVVDKVRLFTDETAIEAEITFKDAPPRRMD